MKIKESKICAACKRSFDNRKRWSSRGIWSEVVYCGDRCRKKLHMNPNLFYVEILQLVEVLDIPSYTKTRNYLEGTVSMVSPYISRGAIDLPTIKNRIFQKYSPKEVEKFIQELA